MPRSEYQLYIDSKDEWYLIEKVVEYQEGSYRVHYWEYSGEYMGGTEHRGKTIKYDPRRMKVRKKPIFKTVEHSPEVLLNGKGNK